VCVLLVLLRMGFDYFGSYCLRRQRAAIRTNLIGKMKTRKKIFKLLIKFSSLPKKKQTNFFLLKTKLFIYLIFSLIVLFGCCCCCCPCKSQPKHSFNNKKFYTLIILIFKALFLARKCYDVDDDDDGLIIEQISSKNTALKYRISRNFCNSFFRLLLVIAIS
jgi:hypothetical protein